MQIWAPFVAYGSALYEGTAHLHHFLLHSVHLLWQGTAVARVEEIPHFLLTDHCTIVVIGHLRCFFFSFSSHVCFASAHIIGHTCDSSCEF